MGTLFKKIVDRTEVTATGCSVAVGGDNDGPISITQGPSEEQIKAIVGEAVAQYCAANMPSDETACPASEAHLDKEIDRICEIIKRRKAKSALGMLDDLYEKIAESAPKRIIFRIIANRGICNLLLGRIEVAAKMLLEAYGFAKNEPKAISNFALGLILQKKYTEAYAFSKSQLGANQD
ncbi:MAG TPA: hypothetical protein VN419_07190, partial [Humidesulfovibrio sp.]|uniref:tetratricopeptide repeat protein n=1 Tax=Humidesulfovibrio sp. TaxID=2910988 RepID=UPI002B7DF8F0